MNTALTVWKEPAAALVSKSEMSPPAIVAPATALSTRDRKQIITAFEVESYEMVAGFVLNKSLAQLKQQLSSLGMEFVGEMLGRQDLDEDSIATVEISNFEAINLAKELGMVSSLDAKRLSQHAELLAHIDSMNSDEAEISEMTREEAVSFLRTCVNSVLGRAENYAPTSFLKFREALESKTFKKDDSDVTGLLSSPYFFLKTTLSILLSGIKARGGAQYEHLLGNCIVIIPAVWNQLRDPEKWGVGQAYAEAVNGGESATVIALRKALTAVHGFDFVPETLRSQTFSAAASQVINVHGEANNFYSEPPAIAALAKLGSTIPWPAFPICMSAILAVRLGNTYGHAWSAQPDATKLLKRLTDNQWAYYLNECLPNDQLVLSKIAWSGKPRERWMELVQEFELKEKAVKNDDSKRLIAAGEVENKVSSRASKMLEKMAQR